jgi:ABC-type sugar transport system ATPase subunit
VIFVSHRLSELFRCARYYVVLRDGATVAQGRMSETSRDDLVAKMLGRVEPDSAAPTATASINIRKASRLSSSRLQRFEASPSRDLRATSLGLLGFAVRVSPTSVGH